MSLSKRMEHGHWDLSCSSALVRLGTKADLAGNDGRAELSFSTVIIRRNVSIVGPVVETIGIISEDILNAPDS